MARSQPYDDQDPWREQTDGATDETEQASAQTSEEAAGDPNADEPPTLPTLDDLESQGFTPEQVRHLMVLSDRAADSSESRAAEAELRRLRFTRWLIEHGVLDEWSA